MEGYTSSGWGSFRGPEAYILCAAQGTILTLSSAVAPRLAPGPRAIPGSRTTPGSRATSTLATGSGMSS